MALFLTIGIVVWIGWGIACWFAEYNGESNKFWICILMGGFFIFGGIWKFLRASANRHFWRDFKYALKNAFTTYEIGDCVMVISDKKQYTFTGETSDCWGNVTITLKDSCGYQRFVKKNEITKISSGNNKSTED